MLKRIRRFLNESGVSMEVEGYVEIPVASTCALTLNCTVAWRSAPEWNASA
jgi:hypothetical protein